MATFPTYIEKPADFSFQHLKSCNADVFLDKVGLEAAKSARVRGVPNRGPKKKFLTKSIWFNNNKLKTFRHLDQLMESVLERPDQLEWLDLSFNQITTIDECINKFPNLKILYLHGNCITDLNEIGKLKKLKSLKTLTLHGNPVANHPRYRGYTVTLLPQLANIDFTPITKVEKFTPPPMEALKYFKDEKKEEEKRLKAKS